MRAPAEKKRCRGRVTATWVAARQNQFFSGKFGRGPGTARLGGDVVGFRVSRGCSCSRGLRSAGRQSCAVQFSSPLASFPSPSLSPSPGHIAPGVRFAKSVPLPPLRPGAVWGTSRRGLRSPEPQGSVHPPASLSAHHISLRRFFCPGGRPLVSAAHFFDHKTQHGASAPPPLSISPISPPARAGTRRQKKTPSRVPHLHPFLETPPRERRGKEGRGP